MFWFVCKNVTNWYCQLIIGHIISKVGKGKNNSSKDGKSHQGASACHDVLEDIVVAVVPNQVSQTEEHMPHDREGEYELASEQDVRVNVLLQPVAHFVKVAGEEE